MGSETPNVRRNPSILRAACVSSHFLRRTSRGCAESGTDEGEVLVVCEREGPTPARSVSWIPGAEGAPMFFEERWLWVVEWPAAGAILIDCEEGGWVSWMLFFSS